MAGRTVEVMAGGAFFGRDQLAVAADGRAYYYGSSGHGAVPHHHHFVRSGAGGGGSGAYAPAGGAVVAHEAGVVAAGGGGGIGIGMAPASFAAAAAGYGAPAHVVLPVAASTAAGTRQHPPAAADGDAAAVPFKGAWTKEEDEVLREMVGVHGDRKWATIARRLPGRIGKQCRERWINHLHPGIKKDVWTEEEDMALIEAHRSCGNRWSVIARHLPGRSENSVKNHWNATKRGLKAKRRVRKRNSELPPPPLGQLSLLAEYIRSLCPGEATAGDSEAAPPPPPPATPPVTSSPPASDDHAQAEGSANPQPVQSTAEMYLDQVPAPAPAPAPMADLGPYGAYAGGMLDGRYSYYLPPYAHMNLHYGPLQMAPPTQVVGGGALHADFHHAAPYAVVEGMNNYLLQQQHQFVAEQINLARNAGQEMEFDDRESSTNNHGTGGYYGDAAAAAGPSSGAGENYQEEMEVVQLASREFAGRDQDGLTLDLTKFR